MKEHEYTVMGDTGSGFDELSLVDPDIAEMFTKGSGAYYTGTPSLIQLSRNIKELTKVTRELLDTLNKPKGGE